MLGPTAKELKAIGLTLEDLILPHGGILNWGLIVKQGLDGAAVKRIGALHKEKGKVYGKMIDTDVVIELHVLANELTRIEFALQKEWGFPQDANYHRWYEAPKCACPKLDNEDCYGTSRGYVSDECPVHGSIDEEEQPVVI